VTAAGRKAASRGDATRSRDRSFGLEASDETEKVFVNEVDDLSTPGAAPSGPGAHRAQSARWASAYSLTTLCGRDLACRLHRSIPPCHDSGNMDYGADE
jgi:hypothetical protein